MIQGLTALLPILNKAVELVPDKNKIAKHKADLEKELLKALVDVDKEQAKINREDAKATGSCPGYKDYGGPHLHGSVSWHLVFNS